MVYHDVSEASIKYENNQGKEMVDGLLKQKKQSWLHTAIFRFRKKPSNRYAYIRTKRL